MKIILLSALALGACNGSMPSEKAAPAAVPTTAATTTPVADARYARVVIPVAGMKCSKCAMNIERSLKRLDGVQSAAVDFDKKQVDVAYDENKLTPARLVDEIKKIGFEPGTPVKG